MTPNPNSPWSATWTIVHTDLDISHVMTPLSGFRLENTNSTGNPASYRIVQNQTAPSVDCFNEAVLRPAGVDTPSFSDITRMSQLPLYGQDTASRYVDVSELMSAYLTANTTVQRLEGLVRIPPATASSSRGVAPHAVIPTTLHLYLFSNAIVGGLPLLVVRAPLSPLTPMNGDGGAMGYGRY
jgi:hypothetical protein